MNALSTSKIHKIKTIVSEHTFLDNSTRSHSVFVADFKVLLLTNFNQKLHDYFENRPFIAYKWSIDQTSSSWTENFSYTTVHARGAAGEKNLKKIRKIFDHGRAPKHTELTSTDSEQVLHS